MRNARFLPLFVLVAIGIAATKDKPKPPSQAELDEISARGRALYQYDQAAWHGTDAARALNPPEGSVQRYLVQKTDFGWAAEFGHFNSAGDAFVVTYEAIPTSDITKYDAKKLDPAREDRGPVFFAARAIGIALQDFSRPNRPYNTAAIPAPDGNIFVYLYPAQTDPNIYPLGGDVRYLFSANGSKILDKRQLHKSVLENDPRRIPPGGQFVGGWHGHILSDVPEDTDVLYVLTRKPSKPETISTEYFVYEVKPDGSIRVSGKR